MDVHHSDFKTCTLIKTNTLKLLLPRNK